jgi:hypothetical protein
MILHVLLQVAPSQMAMDSRPFGNSTAPPPHSPKSSAKHYTVELGYTIATIATSAGLIISTPG